MIKNINYAYYAGLMDADGSFGLYIRDYGKYKSYVPKMQLYNTKKSLIDWVNNVFGIKYRQHSIRKNPLWSDCYVSYLTSTEIINILPKIIPYLILKKNRGKLLLEACLINKKLTGVSSRFKGGKKLHDKYKPRLEAIRLELLELNKKGTHPKEVQSII